jgi:hypothetical protein
MSICPALVIRAPAGWAAYVKTTLPGGEHDALASSRRARGAAYRGAGGRVVAFRGRDYGGWRRSLNRPWLGVPGLKQAVPFGIMWRGPQVWDEP